MLKYLFIFIPSFAFANPNNPLPFPVFVKQGFSSILEFEQAPIRLVKGDDETFQIERFEKSIAIKALVPYATTNMFVYFKNLPTQLLVVTASEEAEPTYYKKFEVLVPDKENSTIKRSPVAYKRELKIISSQFDKKKDYLTVEVSVSADRSQALKPKWDLVRLMHKDKPIAPNKLWSERREVQKDSKVKARFIFNKPNLPRDLKGVSLILPLNGNDKPMSAKFAGGK